MPITPTPNIWMNGEMVPWEDAQIHVLSHTLHYGTGVFEGIRADETADGPAVFRLTEHIERLYNSARILNMPMPYSVAEIVQACKDVVADTGLSECYLRPIAYYGYGEMGLATAECKTDIAIAAWPWGAYLGDDAVTKGVRLKISSWTRHDHNIMPPASKTTGNYANSTLAKMEAMRAGYDEAIMLNGAGLVSECSGENIFVGKGDVLISPPTSSGVLPGITQHTVMSIAEDLGHQISIADLARSDLYTADEMFVCGTAAEVSAVNSVDDRDLTCPGPRTKAIADAYAEVVRGKNPKYQSWNELGDMTDPEVTIDRSAVRDRAWPERVEIYDTTLRDGSQLEGISLTVDDKLRIAEQLDLLGVGYIEGGWPGANPKDDEFFARAREELKLTTSEFVAFGSTRRAKGKVDSDETLANLVAAGTGVVCIVGKCWDYHVTEALNTTLDEGVAMVADSVEYLVGQGKRVFFDAEHFFDGYKRNPEFSLRVIEAAAIAGAEAVVLCDTNGGSLPPDIESAVRDVAAHVDCGVGIHLHNDTGCGVANALAVVRAGATQVQGTINGYGERVGNCDLVPIMANLELKMGIRCLPEGRLANLTPVAHHIAELVNFTPDPQQPYVGATAFAHKAGLHTSALSRRSDAYEHVAPDTVGNGTRVLVSEMAGRSTLEMKAADLGLEIDGKVLGDIIDTLKRLEHSGYHFEAADASLELLMRGAAGWEQPYFTLESFTVDMAHRSGTGARAWNDVAVDVETEATVKLWVDGERRMAVGEGNGPVNALDAAVRAVLGGRYPELDRVSLTDFKVRVLDTEKGTGAITRVLLDSTNGERTWSTIGVSENIIEASWQALIDSLVYGLLHTES